MKEMTKEKREYIKKVFSDTELFEEDILNVVTTKDREEIMKIIAELLVRDLLKDEINFLYMRSFSDFSLTPIPNIIYKEIASEWVVYAMEVLHISREDALQELHGKDRVQFILSLVRRYLKEYRSYIFEEIANSFIELVDRIPNARNGDIVIEEVLESDFILNKKLLYIRDFGELWRRVRIARNSKSLAISKIEAKIDETRSFLERDNISQEKKDTLSKKLENQKIELEELSETTLDKFDDPLQKVKDAMINSMMKMKI